MRAPARRLHHVRRELLDRPLRPSGLLLLRCAARSRIAGGGLLLLHSACDGADGLCVLQERSSIGVSALLVQEGEEEERHCSAWISLVHFCCFLFVHEGVCPGKLEVLRKGHLLLPRNGGLFLEFLFRRRFWQLPDSFEEEEGKLIEEVCFGSIMGLGQSESAETTECMSNYGRRKWASAPPLPPSGSSPGFGHPQTTHRGISPPSACKGCQEEYPLPPGAVSWRCQICGVFNHLRPIEGFAALWGFRDSSVSARR